MTGIRWKKTMVFQKGTEEDDTNFTVEIKGGTYQRRTVLIYYSSGAWEKTCLIADFKKVCGYKKEATAFLCVYN